MQMSRYWHQGAAGVASVARSLGREGVKFNLESGERNSVSFASACFSLPKYIVIDNKLNLFSQIESVFPVRVIVK